MPSHVAVQPARYGSAFTAVSSVQKSRVAFSGMRTKVPVE